MTTSDENEPSDKKRSSTTSVIVVLTGLFVVYPLSVGPVCMVFWWLYDNGYNVEDSPIFGLIYGVFYAPIHWLADNNETIEAFFEWYLDFWVEEKL